MLRKNKPKAKPRKKSPAKPRRKRVIQRFMPWEDKRCGGCALALKLRCEGKPGAGCADHEKPTKGVVVGYRPTVQCPRCGKTGFMVTIAKPPEETHVQNGNVFITVITEVLRCARCKRRVTWHGTEVVQPAGVV